MRKLSTIIPFPSDERSCRVLWPLASAKLSMLSAPSPVGLSAVLVRSCSTCILPTFLTVTPRRPVLCLVPGQNVL